MCACACVLCITLFRILMLTVGHDSTPKCMGMTLFRILMLTVGHNSTPKYMCMLCMTLFGVLILTATVGHDSLMCVCVHVHVLKRIEIK